MQKILLIFLACVLAFGTSGCFLAPAIESVQSAGLTQSGREYIFNKEIKEFHHALFWGRSNEALAYVDQEHFEEMKTRLLDLKERGRIVDTKIEVIDFDSDAYNAIVEIDLKIHDFSTNVVMPRKTIEHWVFSVGQGWRIASIVPKEKKSAVY